MSISSEQLQPVAVGSEEHRVEALRLLLGYPLEDVLKVSRGQI